MDIIPKPENTSLEDSKIIPTNAKPVTTRVTPIRKSPVVSNTASKIVGAIPVRRTTPVVKKVNETTPEVVEVENDNIIKEEIASQPTEIKLPKKAIEKLKKTKMEIKKKELKAKKAKVEKKSKKKLKKKKAKLKAKKAQKKSDLKKSKAKKKAKAKKKK